MYEFERSIEEIEFEFPRAKKAVWERRSVVSVVDAGVRSRKAGVVVS